MSERFLTDHQKTVEEAAGMALDWGMANAFTVARSQPIHTPGPLEFLELGRTEEPHNRCKPLTICEGRENGDDVTNVYSADDSTVSITREQAIGNARLLAAAYNAFDSAARKLGLNAVELAEGLQHGAIADLISALEQAREHINGEIDVVDGDYGVPAPNKAMTLAQEIDAALGKVKGDAS